MLEKLIRNDTKNVGYNVGMAFSSLAYFVEGLNLPNYENYDPLANNPKSLEESKILRYFIY